MKKAVNDAWNAYAATNLPNLPKMVDFNLLSLLVFLQVTQNPDSMLKGFMLANVTEGFPNLLNVVSSEINSKAINVLLKYVTAEFYSQSVSQYWASLIG